MNQLDTIQWWKQSNKENFLPAMAYAVEPVGVEMIKP